MAVAAAAAEAFNHAAPSRPPLPASRQEVQAAVAKAVELRALHAALRQRGAPNPNAGASRSRSPATIRLPPAASPARSRTGAASAGASEDYPVFTPTYEEEPAAMVAGLNDICQDTRSRSENWSGITLDRGGRDGGDEAAYSDYDNCLNGFSSSNSDFHYAPSSTENHLRTRGAHRIYPAFLQSAPLAGRFAASAVPVGDEAAYSDYDNCLNGFSSSNSDFHYAPSSTENHLRTRGAHRIYPAFLQSAPLAGRFAASAGRVTGTAELKAPPASCSSAFRPATIGGGHGGNDRFLGSSNRVPPSSSQHPSASTHSRARQRGSQILSWFFPKARKKAKSPLQPTAVIERENMSQLLKEWGLLSLDSAKKELAEANAHRDAAMEDAAEMRSSLGELTTKMMSLEAYCSELKNALRQATDNPGSAQPHSRRSSSSRSIGASREPPSSMPVSHEAMVEGFLQIASEARLSVKQLCKSLIQQAEDPDNGLSEKLNLLLQPYQLAITAGRHCSKAILYHLEAIMNQSLYQDFENCSFQRNGAPRHLDPNQDRRESFASFVALRNLSWSEVLRKGTRYYSEDLSRFCDQKMSCVVAALGWSWPWPEQLLQCFFVATKCVWLLHLLAFSFGPPLPILRVEEGRAFDQMYMEDILPDKRQVQDSLTVKTMVMPGFYVQDRVLKCRVLTTRSVA